MCLCLFYYDDGTESNKFGYIAVVTPLRRPTANCFTVPASHKYFITVYPLPLPFPLSPAGRSLPLNQADSSFHTLPARAEKEGRERKVGWLVGVPLFRRLAALPSRSPYLKKILACPPSSLGSSSFSSSALAGHFYEAVSPWA